MNNKKEIGTGERGFTLIEVLIAMAIFAIGILGVAAMQISSTNGNTSARKHSEASEFAQEQVELLMAAPFANLAGNARVTADGYTVTWIVGPGADIDADGNNDIVQITVTVTDPAGRLRSSLTFTRSSGI